MRCFSCQFDNPPAMKFCGQCGTQLVQLCPRCGAENQPTFKFCGQCGAALPAPQPPEDHMASVLDQIARRQEVKRQGYTPSHLAEKILQSRSALEGERRQVTVLFADMTGFTPWPRSSIRKRCTRLSIAASSSSPRRCTVLKARLTSTPGMA